MQRRALVLVPTARAEDYFELSESVLGTSSAKADCRRWWHSGDVAALRPLREAALDDHAACAARFREISRAGYGCDPGEAVFLAWWGRGVFGAVAGCVVGPGACAPAPGDGSGGLAQKCAQFVQSLLSVPRDSPRASGSWGSDSDDDADGGCGGSACAMVDGLAPGGDAPAAPAGAAEGSDPSGGVGGGEGSGAVGKGARGFSSFSAVDVSAP